MSTGKMVSQAGHAYLSSWLNAFEKDPSLAKYYASDMGVKICLESENLGKLLLAENAAKEAGIPYFRVTDSGCANFHGGHPTITALGLGPATKTQIKHITKRFQLM